MKLRPHQRVDYPTAKERALAVLGPYPIPASSVAVAIWPDNEMTAQGAGAAASRILKRMQGEDLACWTCVYSGRNPSAWGWVRLGNPQQLVYLTNCSHCGEEMLDGDACSCEECEAVCLCPACLLHAVHGD